ncbi:MAG: hypothetical protein U5L96_00655 [Owenweeksia sp.]|nr:hypothetical protein [Owenweeksia sp.]
MRLHHMGFNPYFHSASFITRELLQQPDIKKYARQVTQVYFYGAGCSAPQLNAIVKEGLSNCFTKARIEVGHDLKASAYATYSGEPAITCILGTGSNSVYFDGHEIYEEVPSLAFILGDEGSASYIGKKVLTAYFYKQMPPEAARAFEEEFNPKKDVVIDQCTISPIPTSYLAGFGPFCPPVY